TADFRDKYRQKDLLLVDDIQFIAGKQQTQEEFFHTFNALYESGHQIVLTSDRPPKEMTQLEDRLRTRFEWGLMVDVEPPDYETRLAIIRNKAVLLGLNLPDRITTLIAENITANVRQIEGALNKVLAYRDLIGAMDEEAIIDAIKDELKSSSEYVPSEENIAEYIAKFFNLELDVLRGNGQGREVTHARQIAMYLIRRLRGTSLKDIGKYFEGRDHTTVLYSLKQVEKKMRSDPAFAETVKEITTNINSKT
ncbi:MAG: chromosomal replication initiator protein DnaA, partial [Lachnospiraceae bacterium]|nr:chromosomal replication initiator protein DnaA [Lachnospiraceae bacterium]